MKFILPSVALFATLAVAQFGDIPTCAYSCLTDAVSETGCDVDDLDCACGDSRSQITTNAESCLERTKDCDDEDDEFDVQSVLNEFCSDAQGVTSSLADASSTLASFASDATESFASATESLASAASSVTESLASVASSITDDAASATSETGNAAMPTHAMLDKWNGLAAVGVAVGVLGL